MATYVVNSAAANDSGAGTAGDPWKYIPGMASANGAHTLVANVDTVEIVNGSAFTERLTTVADGILYRGRGIGGTSIVVRTQDSIPAGSIATEHTFVRTAATNEGSWQIDLTGNAERTNGADEYCLWVQHEGCTFEDIEIIGGAYAQVSGNAHTVYLEPEATQTTFNRFLITGSAVTYTTGGGGGRTYSTGASNGGRGMYCDAGGLTLYQGAIKYAGSDCLSLRGRLTGFVSDLTCSVRYCEFTDPNTGWDGASYVARQGDTIQMNPSTVGTEQGVCEIDLLLEHCYLWKTDPNKQALVMQGSNNPQYVRYNLFEGVAGGACSILSNLIRSTITISENYFKSPSPTLAVMRVTVPDDWNDTEDPVELCHAAGALVITNNIVSGNCGPFLQITTNNNGTGVPLTATLTWEGDLTVTGNFYLSEETGPGETSSGNASGLLLHSSTNVLKWLETAVVTVSDNEFWSYEKNDNDVITHIPTFILPPQLYGAGPTYTPSLIQASTNWIITDNYFRRTAASPSAANATTFQVGVTGDQNTGTGVTTYQDIDASTTGVEAFEAAMAAASGNFESFADESGGGYVGGGRVMMV